MIAALFIAAWAVSAAPAANAPDRRLDAAASEVARHPVFVWCETDEAAWAVLVRGSAVERFTVAGQPIIWLSPPVCLALRRALDHKPPEQGGFPLGQALFGLLHEALHQRGEADDTKADCGALALVPEYAVALLGISQRVYVTKTVWTRRVRVGGRWIKKRIRVLIRVRVPNPKLAQVIGEATTAWSNSPYNRGPCSPARAAAS
jgi:hypothetical protein